MDREYRLLSENDCSLCCISNTPKDVGKASRGALLLHGFGSNKNNKMNSAIVPVLNQMGIASVRFDFQGHGESSGDTKSLTISSAANDTRTVYDDFRRRHLARGAKVILIASSFGGSVALRSLKNIKNLGAVFLRAPIPDYEAVRRMQFGDDGIDRWLQTGFIDVDSSKGPLKSGVEFLEDARNHNIFEEVNGNRIPIRIVHGTLDDNVPVSQSKELVQVMGPNATLRIVENAGHGFSEPENLTLLVNDCVDFISANLSA